MKIIAFGHRKGVGKDTAAKFLITILRQVHTRKKVDIRFAGFADKIKQQCYELYGHLGMMPGLWYEEPENLRLKDVILPLLGKSPRQVWISYGNSVSEIYPRTWSTYLFQHHSTCDYLIIKDLRRPIEADHILELGGNLVCITRSSSPKVTDNCDDLLERYAKWNWLIENEGTLNTLYQDVYKTAQVLELIPREES